MAVGFGIWFIVSPLTFYMVNDIDASPAQQSVIMGLMSLPWAFKIGCGFLTDAFPIYGLRRKPYFIFGWCSWLLCNLVLVVNGKPSIEWLAVFVFLMTLGFVQADVCTDAMIVEKSKAYENDKTRGTLQAFGYSVRFFGAIVGALMGMSNLLMELNLIVRMTVTD